MNCPVCREVQLVMSERQGIEIDYCPQCRGVWLDRGELDKIIDRSNGENQSETAGPTPNPPRAQWQQPSAPTPLFPPQPIPPQRYPERRDDDDYRRGKRKKRGGLLGDLFDFDS